MSYYSQRLAGERLKRVYEIAPSRVQQYLQAEIDFVASQLSGTEELLELGCGYGRVMAALANSTGMIVGIDTALESLALGRAMANSDSPCSFLAMDARELGFTNNAFDRVICVQNGICAFRLDQQQLLREALRVTKPNGSVIVSTYAREFWDDRLHWFELQAREGLVGPIDYQQSVNGTIVCTDGFRSGSLAEIDFERLGTALSVETVITKVNHSSLFCSFSKR